MSSTAAEHSLDPLTMESFTELIHAVGPFEENPTLAVAVSGGADSFALTLLAQEWIKEVGGKLVALTVDHGIREEATTEAKQVAKWLKELSIEHHILTHEGPTPTSNIQEDARNIRYQLLTEYCLQHNILHLLVAHHREDQAETFLMRLHRGSGIDGLAAMAPVSAYNNIRIIRPLLDIPRAQLRAYLEAKNQDWIEDPSNQDPAFTRNNLRRLFFTGEENNNLAERMAETAKHMAGARQTLEECTAQAMTHCLTLHPAGYCRLNTDYFSCLPDDIALRILAATLTTLSGHEKKPRFDKLERLYEAIKTEDELKGRTLWGCKLYPDQTTDDIIICREYEACAPALLLTPETPCKWDNRFQINIGKTEQNITVGALGPRQWNQLRNQQPELNKTDLPKTVLYTVPALTDDLENVLSVPHIDYYNEEMLTLAFSCVFAPAKPLAGVPHGWYN